MSSDEEVPMDESESEEEEKIDEFLDFSSLEEEMSRTISEVQELVQVKTGVCRILLHKYKWNKESLLERFYEKPDTNAFLIEAHVIPSETETDPPFPAVPADDAECEICCDTNELTGLACKHRACAECWRSYITDKVMEGGQSEIECMASDCKLIAEEEKIMLYIKDPVVTFTYRKRLVDSFVETNKLLRWCPGIDCGKAVKASHCETRLVVCSCGSRFCFSCGNDWHEPLNCRLTKLWMKRCNDDSETFNWIIANTKDCPKCLASIEKNGGCNYIMCTNTSCRYQFCWICMKSWDVHRNAWYKCNSFEPDAEADREKNRSNHHRYLFYYNRYMAHQQSLKLEAKLCKTVEKKMEQMETMGMSWSDVQYLIKAVTVLSECRRTLMSTYSFAFYLKSDNNSIIFETNQKDLEMSTEELSGFLERDLENENLVTLKQKVQDKCRYVEHRRKTLLDHCAEGTEQDTWVYNE